MTEFPIHRDLILDPALLKKENYSTSTQRLIQQWYQLKSAKDLFVVHGCDDARVGDGVSVFNSPGIISLRSIAAANVYGGDADYFNWVYNHPSTRAIFVTGHFDGATFVNGEEPLGCGGLNEKRKIAEDLETRSRKTDSAAEYVRKIIAQKDPLKQAIVSAFKTAEATDKPIVAGLIDHSTMRFIPAMIIWENGRQIRTEVPIDRLFSSDNKKLYENGIPEIAFDHSNPDWLFGLRQGNLEVVESYGDDFVKSQKVQDPHTVVVSTEIRPLSIRFPDTFGKTNTAFFVSIPYSKDDEGAIDINGHALLQSIAQVEYPISHTINAQKGESFYNTRNILIETPDLELSRLFAKSLVVDKAWIKKWLDEKNGQILVAQVNGAQTNFMERYKTI